MSKQPQAGDGQYKGETFGKYLTRPTGFGRTSWTAFALIQSMVIAMISAGAATINEAGWVAFVMAAAIEAVLFGMSYRNYTGQTR